jgi:hypothetical protein
MIDSDIYTLGFILIILLIIMTPCELYYRGYKSYQYQ